ncbi:MAG: hypothetical protein LBL18_05380, partial [Bacteroidales bacterium]|nr:hypothetical protein [Bacteroidales bacterium]
MKNNQNIINQRIKEFVRKFYLNRLYKGCIFFVAILLIAFIGYAVLEYFSFFNSNIRLFLMVSYLLLFLAALVFYIIIPLLKIGGVGKVLTREQIARIIGDHFPEIDDKLLNYFQLEEQITSGDYKSEALLLAAINLKIEKIAPFPFLKAIPFHKTRKYLKWAIIPILLFALIFSIKSEIFTDSTQRIVHYNQKFEKPAPYKIVVRNDSLMAFQNDEFEISVKIVGEEAPNELFITYNDKSYKCAKQDNTTFSYKLKNLQKTIDFQLYTEETASPLYTLKVLPKPVTISFVMQLHYPVYLNKINETIENNGDFTVPEGTEITWKIYTKNTDSVQFICQEKAQSVTKNENLFTKSLRAFTSFPYAIINSNRYYISKDTLKYNISVVRDQYPEIYIESQRDSLYADRLYFKGMIKDDYGFSNLNFIYNQYDADGKLIENNKSATIKIDLHNTIQELYYYFDASTLGLSPGDYVEYHFEVFDNDGVHGSKMSKTMNFEFKIKTMDEIDMELNQSSNASKQQMEDLMKESNRLVKDIEKLNQQLMQTNNPSWQDKKKLEDLMKKYEELKKQVSKLNKQQKEKQAIENQFKNYNEDVLNKQKELEKRMENLLSDDLKALMEKMQQMLNQINKDQMRETMDKMKNSAEDINKQLDQQLEMYKHLEYEKKYNDVIDKTRELAKKQQKLSQQSENRQQNKNEALQQQEKLEQDFIEIQKDLKELEQLNKALEEPNKMSDKQELQQTIKDEMRQSKEALSKNQQQKASDKQKKASESLEELSDQMEQELYQNQAEQIGEDMEEIRQILDNLIKISFRQEDNMKKTAFMNVKSSMLSPVILEQRNVANGMKMIEDSLSKIAKRQVAVRSFILKEVSKIREALNSTAINLDNRTLPNAAKNEQVAFTSMNNLALMLSESLKEMKQQQQECNSKCNKSGNQNCSKPGKGNKSSSAKRARELQEQLNRQMEAMKRSIQQGQQQGEQQKQGQHSLSEQFAKMAAQQEAIRRMMQEYQDELKTETGVGNSALDRAIE